MSAEGDLAPFLSAKDDARYVAMLMTMAMHASAATQAKILALLTDVLQKPGATKGVVPS